MNGQHHGGKGSAQRPSNKAKFDSNWDAIFAPEKTKYRPNNLMQYIAMMEPRGDMLQDCEAFIFEASSLEDAKAQIAEKDFPNHYQVYVQGVNSLYFNHPERKNKNALN